MGFFTFAAAGCGLILVGTFEAAVAAFSSSSSSSTPPPQQQKTTSSKSSFLYFLLASLLSLLFILNSLISYFDAVNHIDRIGSAQQLQVLSISALFLLYSLTGLIVTLTSSSLPLPLLNLIGLFAFVEEFMYFYLQRKDTSGIENRYFDLLLVPIFVCVFSTLLEFENPNRSVFPKLGRGVGLVAQGMWFLQMGVSIYTDSIAEGCFLKEKSRGNYTVKCKGHPEYHRARAIVTLQFNCHLALIVVLVAGVYSVVAARRGVGVGGGVVDFTRYKPLGVVEMQAQSGGGGGQGEFTLDSDEEGEEEVSNVGKSNVGGGGEVELGVNGNGDHR